MLDATAIKPPQASVLSDQNVVTNVDHPCKVELIVFGTLIIIGGLAASGCLLPSMGYSSFAFGGAGLIVGSGFISYAVSATKTIGHNRHKWPHPSTLHPHPVIPLSYPKDSSTTFAHARVHLMTQKTPPSQTEMSHLSLIEGDEKYRTAKEEALQLMEKHRLHGEMISWRENMAMGIMLGMACGDALGACMEFLPYKKEGYNIPGQKIGMQPGEITGAAQIYDGYRTKFHLQPGQWTDDSSMGLCLAEHLITHGTVDGHQLMLAFTDWWYRGYNNAFTRGDEHTSVGLGGNINASYQTYLDQKNKFTRATKGPYATPAGDEFMSGNGSLMRNGPVAIAASSSEEAMQLAMVQSKVTHQGNEAAECCRLMAYLLFSITHSPNEITKSNLPQLLQGFTSTEPSVQSLANSEENVKNAKNRQLENWNWKSPNFQFNQDRINQYPGYIGSYAMDALAMALHCVYTTNSFEDAVLKAISHGGDADSVGAITGQIAGALYGASAIPNDWVDAVQSWDRGGEIAARGLLLMRMQ